MTGDITVLMRNHYLQYITILRDITVLTLIAPQKNSSLFCSGANPFFQKLRPLTLSRIFDLFPFPFPFKACERLLAKASELPASYLELPFTSPQAQPSVPEGGKII